MPAASLPSASTADPTAVTARAAALAGPVTRGRALPAVGDGGPAPPPVLGRAVGREDLRHVSAGCEPPQERAPLARQRILLLGMREREEAPDGMGGVERRLAEATVELAAPRACDVRHHRVEDVAPFFVLVEGEIQEMPEEPPALRNAEHVGAIEGPGAGVPLLRRAEAQEGRRVADRHETEPDEGRILRPVQALVELPRLESAVEGDAGRA